MTIGPIENISGIPLGILGTHLGFLEALVPDDNGMLPRNTDGEFVIAAGARELIELSPVKIDLIQISSFGTTNPDEKDELIAAVRDLGLEPQLVMMVGGVNPMNPDDEDEALAQLMVNLGAALRNNIAQVNSTSVETWMEGTPPSSEEEFELESPKTSNFTSVLTKKLDWPVLASTTGTSNSSAPVNSKISLPLPSSGLF